MKVKSLLIPYLGLMGPAPVPKYTWTFKSCTRGQTVRYLRAVTCVLLSPSLAQPNQQTDSGSPTVWVAKSANHQQKKVGTTSLPVNASALKTMSIVNLVRIPCTASRPSPDANPFFNAHPAEHNHPCIPRWREESEISRGAAISHRSISSLCLCVCVLWRLLESDPVLP